jgi:hypothetical protein
MTFIARTITPERSTTYMAPPITDQPTFASFLADHRRGRLHAELTEKLAELAAEVIAKGSSGKLTLTVAIGHGGEDQVEIADDVKLTLPKGKRGKAVWFATEQGSLSRQPPRQTTVEDEIEARRAEREAGGAS